MSAFLPRLLMRYHAWRLDRLRRRLRRIQLATNRHFVARERWHMRKMVAETRAARMARRV